MQQSLFTLSLEATQGEIRVVDLPPDEDLPSPPPTDEFIKSVEKAGAVLEPIVLAHLPGGGVFVIDGRRRIKTARRLGIETIPDIAYAGLSLQEAMSLGVMLNNRRSANPLADLRAIAAMAASRDDKEIAAATGIPAATVRKILRLRQLHPALLEAVENGKMALTSAYAAINLTKPQQEELSGLLVSKRKISAQDVQAARRIRVHEVVSQLELPPAMMPQPVPPQFVAINGGRPPITFGSEQLAVAFASENNGYKLYRLVPCAPQEIS